MLQEILQVETGLAQLALHALGLLLVERGLRPLDERQYVSHPQNAGSQPVRVKNLQSIGLLARAQKLDRYAGDGPHTDGRSSSSVTIYLGQDQPGQPDLLMKASRNIHCFLACHCIGHQERLDRLHCPLDALQLSHHFPINLETAGGVQNYHIVASTACFADAIGADIGRRNVLPLTVDRQFQLTAQYLQLCDSGWAIGIASDHQGQVTALPQIAGQFRHSRRLARALQPDQHNDIGRGTFQFQPSRLA